MKLHVLPAGPIQTNAYLLLAPERAEAVLIDAPGDIWAEIAPILAEEKCRLTALWLTHGHWDHTQGAAEVVRQTKVKVYAHIADKPLYETPQVMSAFMVERMKLAPVFTDTWVKQGDVLAALGTTFEVRHVPGHCPGNVLFYSVTLGAAFVGDALFAGNVGRTDFPGGSMAMLAESIRQQIYTLPDETVVYPGHGRETTVGEEKQSNPHVRG